MKLKLFLSFLIFIFLLNSCDTLDSLETFPIDVPVSVKIAVVGVSPNINQSADFCLDNVSSIYQDYQNEIDSISFVEAAFRVDSFVPDNMEGNIGIEVIDKTNNVLLKTDIPKQDLGKLKTEPYILSFSPEEVEIINSYLNSNKELCFTVLVNVSDIQGTPPYVLEGYLDLVLKADTKL